jgi:hypothetical protein
MLGAAAQPAAGLGATRQVRVRRALGTGRPSLVGMGCFVAKSSLVFCGGTVFQRLSQFTKVQAGAWLLCGLFCCALAGKGSAGAHGAANSGLPTVAKMSYDTNLLEKILLEIFRMLGFTCF